MNFYEPRYSQTRSEAEIQAELFQAVNQLGLEPRLEVSGYLPGPGGRIKCRFDMVVFWPLNHAPICIVECKKGRSVSCGNTQLEKYEQFGLPIVLCFRNNLGEALDTICDHARDTLLDCPPSLKPKFEKLIMSKTAMLIHPTLEEVLMESSKIDLPEHEARKFFFHYKAIGWVVGKSRTPMKCFKSSLQGWKLRWLERLPAGSAAAMRRAAENAKSHNNGQLKLKVLKA